MKYDKVSAVLSVQFAEKGLEYDIEPHLEGQIFTVTIKNSTGDEFGRGNRADTLVLQYLNRDQISLLADVITSKLEKTAKDYAQAIKKKRKA